MRTYSKSVPCCLLLIVMSSLLGCEAVTQADVDRDQFVGIWRWEKNAFGVTAPGWTPADAGYNEYWEYRTDGTLWITKVALAGDTVSKLCDTWRVVRSGNGDHDPPIVLQLGSVKVIFITDTFNICPEFTYYFYAPDSVGLDKYDWADAPTQFYSRIR